MRIYVSNLVLSANFELRRIISMRHLLSTDATVLVSAFVLSLLSHCNSLLAGCPRYLLNSLQKVQNNAERLVQRVSELTVHLLLLLLATGTEFRSYVKVEVAVLGFPS